MLRKGGKVKWLSNEVVGKRDKREERKVDE